MIIKKTNKLSLLLLFFLLSFKCVFSAPKDVPLISLNNTDFVVAISFIIFILILIFLKVPKKVGTLLDERANSIKLEIDEANKILEDSKSVLADLEREHKLNIQRAEKIIEESEQKAKIIIENAKQESKELIENKVRSAQEQIKSFEKNLIKEIREKAIDLAIKNAQKEIEINNKQNNNKVISNSISDLGKLYK